MSSRVMDETIHQLKDAEIRITPQRQAVLEYLIEFKTHPTADEIYHALAKRFPNMSVATVYNNLRLFTKLGIVLEMNYGDASSRFDFFVKPHYHAICEKCDKVVDIFYPGLDEIEVVAANLTGFQVSHHRMEIYGICPECQEKMKTEN